MALYLHFSTVLPLIGQRELYFQLYLNTVKCFCHDKTQERLKAEPTAANRRPGRQATSYIPLDTLMQPPTSAEFV